MKTKSVLLIFCVLLMPIEHVYATSSEYFSPYFFIFAFIPFVILGPLGLTVGLLYSKERTAFIKVANSLVGLIIGYLLSYGLICLGELLQL